MRTTLSFKFGILASVAFAGFNLALPAEATTLNIFGIPGIDGVNGVGGPGTDGGAGGAGAYPAVT